MSVKRTIPVALIFLASIALGVFYNTYLLEDPWYTSLTYRYVRGLLSVLLLMFQALCIYYLCAPLLKKYKSKYSVPWIRFFIIAIVLYVLRLQIIGAGYINVMIMLYVYPLVFLGIKKQLQNKYGLINVTILFTYLIAICLLVSNIKMVVFSCISFIITEFIIIKLFADNQKKKWYWHAGIIAFVSLFTFALAIFLNWSVLYRRIIGFFNPETVLEYRMLLEWLGNCKLISFNPNTAFVTDINSMTMCTYAHVMTCFGFLPTILFIGSQVYMVFLVFKNSLKFLDDGRKILGIASAIIIAIHLFVSLLSSFYVVPMVGYGAPMIIETGLSYSYVPLLVYFFLESMELYNGKLKDKINSRIFGSDSK